MLSITLLLLLAPLSAAAAPSAPAPPTLDVRAFGAKCDWNGVTGTDVTAPFQAAARAAAKAYGTTRQAQTVTFSGNCVVSGEVSYGSGVHWLGHGAIIVPRQTGFTLHAVNADDVADYFHVQAEAASFRER